VNATDRKEFELVHNKIDSIEKKIDELKHDMSMAHGKTDESLRFLKENLFNPHEGLWAETKKNSEFRESTSKWRYGIGMGFIALMMKNVWEMFN
tara:strand:+ start:600 stop:881 length:282 start_codon:yes stop_codon:yes gene_type:complete